MVLSDRTIREELKRGRIVVRPLLEANVQPASVDVRLDRRLLVFSGVRRSHIDVREDMTDLTEEEEIGDDDPFLLHPGAFVLASTLEHIELPDDIVARLESKSSLNRLGLSITSNSGYVDPGWKGHLTFGLSNAARLPITLYYGMSIGQISFLRLSTSASNIYGSPALDSKYQGQTAPTPSQMFRNFQDSEGTTGSA